MSRKTLYALSAIWSWCAILWLCAASIHLSNRGYDLILEMDCATAALEVGIAARFLFLARQSRV